MKTSFGHTEKFKSNIHDSRYTGEVLFNVIINSAEGLVQWSMKSINPWTRKLKLFPWHDIYGGQKDSASDNPQHWTSQLIRFLHKMLELPNLWHELLSVWFLTGETCQELQQLLPRPRPRWTEVHVRVRRRRRKRNVPYLYGSHPPPPSTQPSSSTAQHDNLLTKLLLKHKTTCKVQIVRSV